MSRVKPGTPVTVGARDYPIGTKTRDHSVDAEIQERQSWSELGTTRTGLENRESSYVTETMNYSNMIGIWDHLIKAEPGTARLGPDPRTAWSGLEPKTAWLGLKPRTAQIGPIPRIAWSIPGLPGGKLEPEIAP